MRKNAKYRDVFFAEILQHLWNGVQGSHLFFGREQELDLAKEYINSEGAKPLIFYGQHGCGKTSILAKIATETNNWIMELKNEENEGEIQRRNYDPVLILRFLGTSPDSSSISPLLISVCEQVEFFSYQIISILDSHKL